VPSFFQSTQSIIVKAPAEKVYVALTDWAERSKWRPGIQMTWEGEPKAFVGQKVTFKVKEGPFVYFFSYRVTGLEPSSRIFMEYTGKPLKGRCALEITPEEEGSRVAFHWMKVEPGTWLARVYFALGLGPQTHRERTEETFRMLKNHLEKN
jgi:uncharacterized protein YndB with AHSA1/START domain